MIVVGVSVVLTIMTRRIVTTTGKGAWVTTSWRMETASLAMTVKDWWLLLLNPCSRNTKAERTDRGDVYSIHFCFQLILTWSR